MASISATGIGSGLDVGTIVSQLMTAEQQPLIRLQEQEASYQTRLTAYGQLKGLLTTLQQSVAKLNSDSLFSATKTSIVGEGYTATSSSSAVPGTHNIEVYQLAQAQRVASSATSELKPANGGDLTITFGKVDENGDFVAGSEDAKTLEFKGGSLEELSRAINDANMGVTASVVDNGKGVKQLVLTGKNTGEEQAFKIEGTGDLTALNFDPSDPDAASTTHVQTAQNARLKVDGLDIQRSTNTISTVIPGVTLTLNKSPEDPSIPLRSTLTVSENYDDAATALQEFADAYNELSTFLKEQTQFTPGKNGKLGTSAALAGDSVARSVQNMLDDAMSQVVHLGGISNLNQVGLSFERTDSDSTTDFSRVLTFNKSKFEEAMKNPELDVSAFFNGTPASDGKAAVSGFGTLMGKTMNSILNSSTGILSTQTQGLQNQIDDLQSRQSDLIERLAETEERYYNEFSRLDSLMSEMSQLQSTLTQMLASLPTIGS